MAMFNSFLYVYQAGYPHRPDVNFPIQCPRLNRPQFTTVWGYYSQKSSALINMNQPRLMNPGKKKLAMLTHANWYHHITYPLIFPLPPPMGMGIQELCSRPPALQGYWPATPSIPPATRAPDICFVGNGGMGWWLVVMIGFPHFHPFPMFSTRKATWTWGSSMSICESCLEYT